MPSGEAHVAGTPADFAPARYVLNQFREAGLEIQWVEYQVLLVTPEEVKVDLVEPLERQVTAPERAWDNGSD